MERTLGRHEALARRYSTACSVPCAVFDSAAPASCQAPCPLRGTGEACPGCDRCLEFGFRQSLRFGGSYVFFCPGALMFWISPLAGGAGAGEGLLAGPVLVLPAAELEAGILRRMGRRLRAVARKEPAQVSALAEVLRMVAGWASEYQDRLASDYRRDEIGGDIFEMLREGTGDPDKGGALYFAKPESEIFDAIVRRDAKAALDAARKELWLLSHYNPGDGAIVQTRLREMATLFSRAAVAGRADERKVWELTRKLYSSLAFPRPPAGIGDWLKKAIESCVALVGETGSKVLSPAVDKAARYAQSNYRRPVPLGEAADHVGLSPNYLCRVFKKETGMTWVEHLNAIRVSKAKELLLRTSATAEEIAEASGFGSLAAFSKTFKRREGVGPSAYRKQGRLFDPKKDKNG